MSTDSKVLCRHPGCSEMAEIGTIYCAKHKVMHFEEVRPVDGSEYSPAWGRASRAFLKSHPLCEECRKQGKFVRATVVDHIVPHRGDESLIWDRSNWRPLCKRCYSKKVKAEEQRPT